MRRRPNPSIMDVDVEELGAGLVGFSGAGLVNDFFLARGIDYFVPTLKNNKAIRKVVDGGTTIFAAFLIDKAFQIAKLPEWGKWAQFGGTMLGGGRILSAVIPGYQISSITPIDSEIGNVFNPNHPVQQVQAAAQNAQLAQPTNTATVTNNAISGTALATAGGLY